MGSYWVKSDKQTYQKNHIPGAFYHIMLRGNDGKEISFSKEDRLYFYFLKKPIQSNFEHW